MARTGRNLFAGGVIATVAVLNPGYAEDQHCISDAKPAYVIKTLAIHDRGATPDIKQLDVTVRLIGEPDAKTFGVSYSGTLTPEAKLAGDEKLVLHLYAGCETGVPSESSMVVGTVSLGTLKKGRESATLIGTADTTALVPLRAVECAKPGID